jgi:intraflagellar transport protein 172
MTMYQDVHKWDQSLLVAELKNHPELKILRQNYMQWLKDSGQEVEAGQIKEEERDYESAIKLYIKGGIPGRAAHVLMKHELFEQRELIEQVANALKKANMHEQAGELYGKIQKHELALQCFIKANAFHAIVELCRHVYPDKVVFYEEKWGDFLVSQRKMDASISHFIEAGKVEKAIDAAIEGKMVSLSDEVIG